MNREVRVIGKKHFGPTIDITDPCYDKDVWCRMNDVSIKEGEYTCMISEATYDDVFNGKPFQYRIVESISIRLSGELPTGTRSAHLGEIGVDAGLAGFFNNKPDYTDLEWKNLCNRLNHSQEEAWIFDEGFFSSSGHGDGSYSVFADRNENNEIVGLVIYFLDV